MNLNWSKEDFKTYILTYIAQSDYTETEEESTYILSKVDGESYKKIHKEISDDNDYQSVEKIQNYLAENSYFNADKQELLKEIQEICAADGSVDILEQNKMMFLKRLLK